MSNSNSEINKAIASCDIENLIYRMTSYTVNRLGRKNSVYNGLEPEDFVFSVFEKALTGIKNWPHKKISFEYFMFKALQNEIWAHLKKLKRRNPDKKEDGVDESYLIDIPDFPTENGTMEDLGANIDIETQKKTFLKLLEDSGASETEIWIFECWCDGIDNPAEISDLIGVEIASVYNALKRLKRRRKKINEERS
ncbi:hypothetical protein [Maribacter sp. 2308TA10-17]|uniref:hypothetical protein n=1 Tax=Maribacter sp. 2308TA10-17 TaxID=3386276 RepID=UPI0039BC759C